MILVEAAFVRILSVVWGEVEQDMEYLNIASATFSESTGGMNNQRGASRSSFICDATAVWGLASS